MNYQSHVYPYPQRNYWVDLLVKAGGLLCGVTVAAVMGAHLIHAYSPPSRTSPVARIVRYYSKGIGHAGQSSHWTMEASEGTREWGRAVRYCQSQSASVQNASGSAGHTVTGCATINTLAASGY